MGRLGQPWLLKVRRGRRVDRRVLTQYPELALELLVNVPVGIGVAFGACSFCHDISARIAKSTWICQERCWLLRTDVALCMDFQSPQRSDGGSGRFSFIAAGIAPELLLLIFTRAPASLAAAYAL